MAIINSGISSVGPDGSVSTIKPSGGTTSGSTSTGLIEYKFARSEIDVQYIEAGGSYYASWKARAGLVPYTEKYGYLWQYRYDDTKNIHGKYSWYGDTTVSYTTNQYCTYDVPDKAIEVRFKLIPVQKEGANKFTASWSDDILLSKHVKDNLEYAGPKPTVSIDGLQLTAEVSIDYDATLANFQVCRNDSESILYHDTNIGAGNIDIRNKTATFTMAVKAGSKYKVRCRVGKDLTSDGSGWGKWSEWSDNVPTIPETPTKITKCEARTLTSVYLEWPSAGLADSYTLEYVTKKSYFDGSNQISSISTDTISYELTGLETGKEYFFRVKAVNKQGDSGWSEIKSVIVGKGPIAPTTWSSTTTAKLGESVTLYWVHNSEDGSAQTCANLELDINGSITVQNIDGETSKWVLDTSGYPEGATIKWRVQTAGVSLAVGDWSIQRTVECDGEALTEPVEPLSRARQRHSRSTCIFQNKARNF